MSDGKSLDMVVFGATGFTGQLVCAHMVERCKELTNLRWAIAGRSMAKLEALRKSLGVPELPIVLADNTDASSIEAMTSLTKLVISTVGP